MVAYLTLQVAEFRRQMQKAETSNMEDTASLEMGQLHHKSTCLGTTQWRPTLLTGQRLSGQAAVLCRQHSTKAQGLETCRQPKKQVEFKNHMYKREFNNSILTTQRHTNEKQEKRSDVYISLREINCF